jgi:hypothetical protein
MPKSLNSKITPNDVIVLLRNRGIYSLRRVKALKFSKEPLKESNGSNRDIPLVEVPIIGTGEA